MEKLFHHRSVLDGVWEDLHALKKYTIQDLRTRKVSAVSLEVIEELIDEVEGLEEQIIRNGIPLVSDDVDVIAARKAALPKLWNWVVNYPKPKPFPPWEVGKARRMATDRIGRHTYERITNFFQISKGESPLAGYYGRYDERVYIPFDHKFQVKTLLKGSAWNLGYYEITLGEKL